MNQINQAQAQTQAQTNGGIFGGTGMWVLQQSLNQITQGILSAWDAALTAAKQRASGDYTGAAVTQRRATGEAWGQGIGTGAGIGIGALLTPLLGPMAIPLAAGLVGEIGKFLGGIDAKKLEENLAYSAQYKNALPGIDTLNQLYGGAINRKSAGENNQRGMDLYGMAVGGARGTGLDTERFIEAMGQTATYGIRDATQAMNMAKTQALWSRFTGADLGTIQKFAGQAYRYGGETNAASLAYGGLKAQDMGKGQYSEFLNSLERVMSESIAKGFVKSTEEIAGNLAMLYKLSGESPLWQGEQGAQRYSQMSNAIANATNLQSVEDVISYGAARDLLREDNPLTDIDERREDFEKYTGKGNVYTGGYADVMQILERGLSADLLKGQWSAVRKLDGNNTDATIERFKTMYGLNYTGASQVWDMYNTAWDEGKGDWREGFSGEHFAKDIKKLQETPQYQSDSQQLQNILNDLRQKGIQIGQIEFFKTELPALEKAMRDLEAALRERTEELSKEEIIARHENVLLSETDPAGKPIKNTISMLIDDEYGVRSGAVNDNLIRLSGAEYQVKDANNKKLGQRYNREVFPKLEELTENTTSKDIIDLVYQMQRLHSNAVTGGEAGNNVGTGEFQAINNKMNELIEALNKNTKSTDNNTESDINLTVENY
jgi:hypothetical protein